MGQRLFVAAGILIVGALYFVLPSQSQTSVLEKRLETAHWTVTVQLGPTGRVYFVTSKTGQVLPSGLTEESLRASEPELHRALNMPLSAYQTIGSRATASAKIASY